MRAEQTAGRRARRGWLALDRLTRLWVRATGEHVDLAADRWLDGPSGALDRVGDDWLPAEARRAAGTLADGGGLLPDMGALSASGFDPGALAPDVRRFYEHTGGWRLEVWSQWCPAAWPFGWLITALFSRRLAQLSLPLRPLDTALGMDSRVVTVTLPDGSHAGTAWLRTLRSTGQTVYSGWYGTATPPRAPGPCVRVVFPLPQGRLVVLLQPAVGRGGSLRLLSAAGPSGGPGAYLVVDDPGRRGGRARRVPLHEEFLVYVDGEGVLRTDHALSLWRIPVVRLHYRLAPPS